MATRNKLPFLTETLARLVGQVQSDEEIVIVDGASTDGTAEYLRNMHEAGRIHCFLSEPDRGEAHALNKGLLMAGGDLIKLVSDDDAFYWPGIQTCKAFMLSHPDVDLLGTEGVGAWWADSRSLSPSHYYHDYERWRSGSTPFNFCGLGLMIRSSSLPLVGLFHTSFVRVDCEFSLRVTSGPANLAWYTGYTWVRIANPQSNSVTQGLRVRTELEALERLYAGRGHPEPGLRAGVLKLARRNARPVWALLAKALSRGKHSPPPANAPPKGWHDFFKLCEEWLEDRNEKRAGEFLCRPWRPIPRPQELRSVEPA